METREWLTIISWPITFILGIMSGGYIVPRLTAKRKILAWTVSEVDLIPSKMSKIVGIPVIIKVGDENIQSLNVVKVKIGNIGNDIIENFDILIKFNNDSKILDFRTIKDLGAYSDKVQWINELNSAIISFKFINPGNNFEFEYTLSAYKPGSINIDCAAPGVVVKCEAAGSFENALSESSFGFSFGFLGLNIRFDPVAVAMREIAEEIRSLRAQLRESSNLKIKEKSERVG